MSAQAAPVAAFVPVNLVDDGVVERTAFARPTAPSTASTAKAMMVEITLRNGRSLRAPANIDRKALASLICCVEAA
jgi:transposase